MRAIGMSINFLYVCILLALGLLVDDTIVVVSAMTSYYKTKKFTPLETGRIVWRDTIVPIWSTTITTIWSFVPLLLATGIIGEFIKPIPVVVTVTMISSTAIAVLITLPFMIVILKPEIAERIKLFGKILGIVLVSFIVLSLVKSNPLFPLIALVYVLFLFVISRTVSPLLRVVSGNIAKNKLVITYWPKISRFIDHGMLDIEVIAKKYHWLITKILLSKKSRRFILFAIIFYAVWAFALLPMGFVKNSFFPKDDQTTLYVNVEYPPGTNAQTTETESNTIFERLRKDSEAEFVTQSLGESGCQKRIIRRCSCRIYHASG
jgi:multidrug efflux pump subunit AcrB